MTVFTNVGAEVWYGDGSDAITITDPTYPDNWVKHCMYHKLATNDATQDALQMYKMFGEYATEENFTRSAVPGGHFGSRDGSEPPESWIPTPQFDRNPLQELMKSVILPYFVRTSQGVENSVATFFVNDSRERVYLANEQTWATVTHKNSMIQPMSGRTTSQITCTIERGNLDFGQPVYAYVFNENGLWNEEGFRVNLGPELWTYSTGPFTQANTFATIFGTSFSANLEPNSTYLVEWELTTDMPIEFRAGGVAVRPSVSSGAESFEFTTGASPSGELRFRSRGVSDTPVTGNLTSMSVKKVL